MYGSKTVERDGLKNGFQRSAHRAFTLIELLIVIGLLGALSGLILPQFSDSSDEAQETVASANLEAISRTLRQFDNISGVFPTMWNTGTFIEDGDPVLMSDAVRDALVTAGALTDDGSGNYSVVSSHTLGAATAPAEAPPEMPAPAGLVTMGGMHVFRHGEPKGFLSANDMLVSGPPPALNAADGFVWPEAAEAILLEADTDLNGPDGSPIEFQGRPLSEICTSGNDYRALILPVTEDIYWTMAMDGENNTSLSDPARAMAFGAGGPVKLESTPKADGEYVWAVFRVNTNTPGAQHGNVLMYLVGVMDSNLNTL